jgi:DNA segregation ATPase FtsK/SpoIIIE, S-DNA-T family
MRTRDPYRRGARRARRAMRRGEPTYPVMVIGPDEPVILLALAALARFAFRHRSAFAPFLLAGAVFVTAAPTHRHHTGWWIPVTAVTALVSVLLGAPYRRLHRYPVLRGPADLMVRLWKACGIDRPIERGYAALVIATTGGWLAAAIANAPTKRPLPAIAVMSTVVLGIPWWFHRRRRARVRVERAIEAWPSIAESVGLPGAHIGSVVVDAWGWTARVILRKGATAAQAIDKLPAIESGFGIRPGSARALPDENRADRFILRVIENDPHANPIPWAGPVIDTIRRPLELGLFEDGRPVRISLLRRNALIGGIVGSGKSGIVNVILAILTACRDVVVWGVDLKGGMELGPWAACLDRLATTPAQTTGLFRDAVTELDRRADTLAARGSRLWEPTPQDPALVIVVDEYAEMPEEAQQYADSLARRGRAVAVNLLAATQRPTQSAMGGKSVRSQMDVRICLRVRERRDVDLILGQGAFNTGWHAHTLTEPGVFLISSPEHGTPERARAYLIDDDQITRHAARYAPQRPALSAPGPSGPSQRPQTAPEGPGADSGTQDAADGATGALWAALRAAGPQGVSVAQLVKITGKGRTWVYERLRELADTGRAVQTIRGHWRATDTHGQTGG